MNFLSTRCIVGEKIVGSGNYGDVDVESKTHNIPRFQTPTPWVFFHPDGSLGLNDPN